LKSLEALGKNAHQEDSDGAGLALAKILLGRFQHPD